MGNIEITLVIRDYDYIGPLLAGDVIPEGIDLDVDRISRISRTTTDPTVQAGEHSFSGYLIRLAHGDRSFVGIPFFAIRSFKHRCFFVRRESGYRGFRDLEGRRIGTNAWQDTGNTWSRAALREQGIGIDRIDWTVGPIDDPTYDSFGHRPKVALPPNVKIAPQGRTLTEMLLAEELDALMCPIPPKGFYDAGSQIARLFPDYRPVEREYYLRTGIFPGGHIIAIRREVFERYPWVARSLYQALDRSLTLWQEWRRKFTEATPWLLADIEEATELIGYNWRPNGVEANQKMIQTLCAEEYEQGLISKPLDSASVFAEFEQVTK